MDAPWREQIWGRRLVVAVPYLWLGLFFLAPFAIVLAISLGSADSSQAPPFNFDKLRQEGVLAALTNYAFLLSDDLYIATYLASLRIAALATLATLLIGYPMAYAIARARGPWRMILLVAVVLPFWTSFLIRVYAWIGILGNTGLFNATLIALGIIEEPLTILGTEWAVIFGIVYAYLPFMVLPLYATLEKMDQSLLDAAADLGARPMRSFFTITLPLSLPGIVAGSQLVFIPAVGEFVIPDLLGGTDTLMIGKVLSDEFFSNSDWPVASAVAMVMLLFLVAPIAYFQRQRARARMAV